MLSTMESIDTVCDEVNEEDLFDTLDLMTTTEVKKEKNKCINCNSENITNDSAQGHVLCKDCDVCTHQIYDNKAEWSMYIDGKNEGSMRCGAPTSFFFPKSSMCTTIGGKKYSIIKTIQIWNQMPYEERSLSEILQFIEHICSKNFLPKSVIDNAKIFYKQIHELKHTIGSKKGKRVIIRGKKNRNGIYGACIFYGALLQKYYRSTLEIAEMLDVIESVITNGCNKFRKLLKNNKLLNSIVPTAPIDFIERYCYKLNLNKEQINIICRIATNITKLYLASNHQPLSIGAGCVLMYAYIYDINIPKNLILSTFRITAVTTDKIFNKILPFRNVIIDDDITNMVRDKLIETKYIAVDSNFQQELESNTEHFKQELLEKNREMLDTSFPIEEIHRYEESLKVRKPRKKKTSKTVTSKTV
jgi:transcription initiation factor TFIIIB Brf1 subunit/transcription initiation factor TFIIB